MILEAINRPRVRGAFFKALQGHPNGHENGAVGEDRLMISGVSWGQYLELDQALGHDRPDPRLYYLDGEIELTSTSLKHEALKTWLADLLGDYLYEAGVETFRHGQPTSGGLDKLEIYRRFAVPEVWLWRKGGLEIWTLRRNRSAYDGPAKKSRLLPSLDVSSLAGCLELESWRQARKTFRETLRTQKR
jgi:Uma2 family endonuclease